MLAQIKQGAIIVLCYALTASSLWITHRVDVLSRKGEEIASKTDRALQRTQQYIDFQLDLLQSDPYQKSIKAGVDTAAIYNASGRYLNRFILPEFLSTVRTANQTLGTSDAALARLADLVRHTDVSLNSSDGLLSAITKIVNKSGASFDELDAALRVAAESLKITTAELKQRLADPRVDAMMDEALGILKEGHGTMEQVHKASEQAPTIAADLEKITRETSRLARITLIANILGTLGRAFLP